MKMDDRQTGVKKPCIYRLWEWNCARVCVCVLTVLLKRLLWDRSATPDWLIVEPIWNHSSTSFHLSVSSQSHLSLLPPVCPNQIWNVHCRSTVRDTEYTYIGRGVNHAKRQTRGYRERHGEIWKTFMVCFLTGKKQKKKQVIWLR